MNRLLQVLALGVFLGLAATALAAPWVEADPNKDYPIHPGAGAWMICAGSYTGPDAPNLARQLVYQVRSKHHLEAFVFNRADEVRKQEQARVEEFKKNNPDLPVPRRLRVRVDEQCAVLVGGYKDVDAAHEALDHIKKLPLPELKLEGKTPYDVIPVATPDEEKQSDKLTYIKVNPFANAFVTRNPTIPQEAKQQPKFDPFWTVLNADEEYSLLKCPKAWTLVVKEYQGASVIQTRQPGKSSGFLDKLGLGGSKPGDSLTAAALQAHEVAKLLREPSPKGLGLKAYVFHTRYSSIVTVGGFDSLEDKELIRMQNQLSALSFKRKDGGGDPIGLFSRPRPMEIPRP